MERAQKALEQLPFVGIVENFDQSIQLMEKWLKTYFPTIEFKSIKANVTQKEGSNLQSRIEGLRAELGNKLYEELLDANNLDLALYDFAIRAFNKNNRMNSLHGL